MQTENADISRPIRRRSIFDNKDEKSVDFIDSEWKRIFGECKGFNETLKKSLYSQEYVEKLQTELEILDSKGQEVVNKKFEDLKELNNMACNCNESILDLEQKEYLNHVSSKMDEFSRSAQDFVCKVRVALHERELQVEDLQQKTDILNSVCSSDGDSSAKDSSGDKDSL